MHVLYSELIPNFFSVLFLFFSLKWAHLQSLILTHAEVGVSCKTILSETQYYFSLIYGWL